MTVGVFARQTLADAAENAFIPLDTARQIVEAAPGCRVLANGKVQLPRLYEMAPLRAHIRESMRPRPPHGAHCFCTRSLFAELGVVVPFEPEKVEKPAPKGGGKDG